MDIFRGAVCLSVGVLLLTGCQQSLIKKPVDPQTSAPQSAALDSVMAALAKRNLKPNRFNDLELIDRNSCRIQVVGHRGYFDAPENSLTAIERGLAAGNDTVELDLMVLRDGRWVLHHDDRTGRTVTRPGRKSDNHYEVARLDGRDWIKFRHRDHETTRVLESSAPPFSNEAFEVLQKHMSSHQRVNLEIKGEASLDDLIMLDSFAKHFIDGRYYYSSGDLDTLLDIRSFNPDVYLGLVNKPNPTSIQLLRESLSGKNERMSVLNSRQTRNANRLADGVIREQAKKNNWLQSGNLSILEKRGYQNFGLHIDIRDVENNPGVVSRLQKAGYKVQTYGINEPEHHLSALASISRKGIRPNGAIIDAPPYALCEAVSPGTIPKASVTSDVDDKSSLILSLPSDADFSDIETQRYYQKQGMYQSTFNGVVSLRIGLKSQDNPVAKPAAIKRSGPGVIQDVEMDTRSRGAIVIDIREGSE